MLHIRRETIKELISQNGAVNVQDLVKHFGVSVETVRRDLEALEQMGYLRRVYGGAISVVPAAVEPAYFWRKEHNQREKCAIADYAASLVKDGDAIILSYGTTINEVARRIRGKKNITVITNSIINAMEFADCPGIVTFCLGGRVREGDMSTAGVLAEHNIKFFNANKLIMGIGGITPELGVTDSNLDESELLRICANNVRCVIAVCDHSKFGVVATYNICPANRLTHLVTDKGVPEEKLEIYRSMGITVHRADVDAEKQPGCKE